MTETKTIFETAAEAADLGKASAAKRGRNPRWPYVPIIDYGPQEFGVHAVHTQQIKGKAFATRDEAVAYAQRVIDHQRALLAKHLALPGYRALREQHGLPRECETTAT